MIQTEYQKKIKKIIRKTIVSMKSIGVYKSEFDETIKMYADTKHQYDILMEEFCEGGCKITDEYTNKFGATNITKTATYLALETIRKDIMNHESVLGLTPAGLKRINSKSTSVKRNGLAEALKNLD